MTADSLGARLDQVPWPEVEAALADQSYARLGRLLTAAECGQLKALYPDDRSFRSRVDMERHRFGAGEWVSRVRSGQRFTLGVIFHDAL